MSVRPVRIALLGASGRMGRAILDCLDRSPGVELVSATVSPSSAWLGRDVGLLAGRGSTGVITSADPDTAIGSADVAIDFVLPEATAGNVAAAVTAGKPLVIGTTGHAAAALEAMDQAASRIPLLVSPNMSIGVNVLLGLAARAAAVLGPDFDVEIYEAHHRHKKDAPSGTALRIGEVVATARGAKLEDVAVYSREHTTAARAPGAIGFAVLRAGDIVGEHTLTFAGPGERLELTHRAQDRSAFALGALHAAAWLVGRAPGRYSMADVLGL